MAALMATVAMETGLKAPTPHSVQSVQLAVGMALGVKQVPTLVVAPVALVAALRT